MQVCSRNKRRLDAEYHADESQHSAEHWGRRSSSDRCRASPTRADGVPVILKRARRPALADGGAPRRGRPVWAPTRPARSSLARSLSGRTVTMPWPAAKPRRPAPVNSTASTPMRKMSCRRARSEAASACAHCGLPAFVNDEVGAVAPAQSSGPGGESVRDGAGGYSSPARVARPIVSSTVMALRAVSRAAAVSSGALPR